MNLLVIGGGGREHAIVKKLKENPAVETIYCAPGNGGIAADAVCVPEIGAKDISAQVDFAKTHSIDFAVVAPDDPLVLGAVDALEAAGIPCFGPEAKAAIIEGSKVFSKDLMKKYGIPTAEYQVFTDAAAAMDYVKACALPVVVKADGLALGKGVLIAETGRMPLPPWNPSCWTAPSATAEIRWSLRNSSPARRSPCWLLPTARPWFPWCPPWTTSGPMTMTRV